MQACMKPGELLIFLFGEARLYDAIAVRSVVLLSHYRLISFAASYGRFIAETPAQAGQQGLGKALPNKILRAKMSFSEIWARGRILLWYPK